MTVNYLNSQPAVDHLQQYSRPWRVAARGDEPAALARIYDKDTNIAIWQRPLSEDLTASVGAILVSRREFEFSRSVTPDNVQSYIEQTLRVPEGDEFSIDIAQLVDMFCCLFERKHAGLRVTALGRAMCPSFHVDNNPCRLVTTYQGPATQWLRDESVDRSKLGRGREGQCDSKSGLFAHESDVQQLCVGEVALLKGEHWEGNEGAGLVHRSPGVPGNGSRLLVTLDMID